MDPTTLSKQMKKWSKYFVSQVWVLEKENKTLKLKILKLTQELEKKKTNENSVDVCVQTVQSQDEQESGSGIIIGSVFSITSPFDEIQEEEEPFDEFIPENFQTETPSMDEDIDIKEEEVGFEQAKLKSNGDISNTDRVLHLVNQSSDTPLENENDKSCHRMFRSVDQVSSNGTARENVGTEIETDLDLNHISPSQTINVLCEKSVNPKPEVSNQRFCGQKKPYLTTRTAEKIHKCETCPKTFDTRFKLMVHNKSHTIEKGSRTNLKTPFKCSVCEKSFSAKRVLTNHMRTHSGENSITRSRQNDGKRISTKRSFPSEKVNPGGRPKKMRKVETEPDVCNYKEIAIVGEGLDPPRVVETNPLKIKKKLKLIEPRRITRTNPSPEVGKGFSAKRTRKKVNPRGRSKKQQKVVAAASLPLLRDWLELEPLEFGQSSFESLDPFGLIPVNEIIEEVDLIDSPCVDGRNPLNEEKILRLILSYLGKHDLLNARMVSHAWNDECLKVLHQSKFTQLLTQRTIKKYTLSFTPDQSRPCIIPFHLNFKIDLRVLGLRTLTKYVDYLCQIFGPECVSTLTLHSCNIVFTEENIRETGLIEFLALISPGLKTLDFTRLYFEIDFLQNEILTFPNLKKLICNTSQCESGRSGPDLLYISIIENSPKLEDLTITHPCDLESWPLNFNQLKSLSLCTLSNPQNILDKILASSGPPVLRELNFSDDVPLLSEDKALVSYILESVASTLKSLTFRERFPFFVERIGIPRIMRFPILPHLEHLGLEYDVGYGHKYTLYSEDINLSAETFPSLKSIELPIGLIFTPSPAQSKEDDDIRIGFPNLIKLTLRVGSNSNGYNGNNGTLEHLQQIFPTPSKLSLVNVGGNESVKYVMDCIMKSNWSKNIQEIGMIGFSQDYLGQLLDQSPGGHDGIFSPVSIIKLANQSQPLKMTNITTIKLELIDKSSDFYRDSSPLSSTASTPNMNGMVKHFPKLQMIEVSEFLFNQWHLEGIWRRHIQEFKSKYPNVVLNVT